MLDQITELVRVYANKAILESSEVAPEQQDSAIQLTAESLLDGITSAVGVGAFPQLIELLSTREGVTQTALFQSISGQLTQGLTTKLGLAPERAEELSGKAIEAVFTGLSSLFNSPEGQTNDIVILAKRFLSGEGSLGSQGLASGIGIEKEDDLEFGSVLSELTGPGGVDIGKMAKGMLKDFLK